MGYRTPPALLSLSAAGVSMAEAAEGFELLLRGPRPCAWCEERAGWSRRDACRNCGAPKPAHAPLPPPLELARLKE